MATVILRDHTIGHYALMCDYELSDPERNMRSLLIGLIILIMILIFWSLRGPIVEVKRRKGEEDRRKTPEKNNQCIKCSDLARCLRSKPGV